MRLGISVTHKGMAGDSHGSTFRGAHGRNFRADVRQIALDSAVGQEDTVSEMELQGGRGDPDTQGTERGPEEGWGLHGVLRWAHTPQRDRDGGQTPG